jgi:hypothetical protein
MFTWDRLKPLLVCFIIIAVIFAVASLFDIIMAVISSRHYSPVLFAVIFGVAGVFGGVIGYMGGVDKSVHKDEMTRWSLIILMVACGIFLFFFLAEWEGGEYRVAMKSYGVTLALSSLLFVKGKVD